MSILGIAVAFDFIFADLLVFLIGVILHKGVVGMNVCDFNPGGLEKFIRLRGFYV